jgi:hypothetical protein
MPLVAATRARTWSKLAVTIPKEIRAALVQGDCLWLSPPIKEMVSCEMLGVREAAFDLYFHKSLKPWRGPRNSVCGWTRTRACFQAPTILARSTRSMRSVLVQAGRFTCRLRVIRGFRNRTVSATNSDLLRERSVSVQSRERRDVRLGPGNKVVVQRPKTQVCQPLHEGENPLHGLTSLLGEEKPVNA